MAIRREILGGGGMLIGGQVLGQACSFARNIVIARLLTPEDFGIAATFGIAVSIFEMVSNIGVDRLLVQAPDGDAPIFQATAHAFQVIRGIGLAILLMALAWPLSRLFGIPQALWAFQCVAIVPLIRGFAHLDPKRFQRQLGFTADIATELLPQIVLVAAAWPIAWWLRDYSAMVWLLVLQVLVSVVTSHAVAERRYAWALNRKFLERMYAFGWPLLLNGLLMFLVFQGDRVIVGSAYDMATLGVYSVAYSITFVPTTMISKVASSVLLPLLSREQGDSRKFIALYAMSVCVLCVVGIAVSTGFILLGHQLVLITYGAKYATVESFIGWMAVMQMLRVIRLGPSIASMAWGDTRNPLVSNIGRISVFPVAIWAALSGGDLIWVVIIGCLGEFIALLMMVFSLFCSRGVAIGYTLKPVTVGSGAVTVAFLISGMGLPSYFWIAYPLALMIILGGSIGALVYWLPTIQPQIGRILHVRKGTV